MGIIPTKRKEISKKFQSYSGIVYGKPEIGKTSFTASLPDVIHMSIENGSKALDTFELPVYSKGATVKFEYIQKCVAALGKENHPYRLVVVDRIDNFIDCILDHVMRINKVTQMNPPGKNFTDLWTQAHKIFRNFIYDLAAIDLNVMFIAHEDIKELTNPDNDEDKFDVIAPQIMGKFYKIATAEIDNIYHYRVYKGNRYIQIVPSNMIVAGIRNSETNFLTTSGEKIHAVPLGSSAKQAAKNFLKAWNNEQVTNYVINSRGAIIKVPKEDQNQKKEEVKKVSLTRRR